MSEPNKNKFEWRTVSIYRDRKYEHIVNKLVYDKDSAIFKHIKDLMVFAAMVGHCFNKRLPVANYSEAISIILGTYANTEHDGFIYLLALMDKKNATCLKDHNLLQSVKVFEEYCNGGLDLINDWFNSNPSDTLKTETIEKKLLEMIDFDEANDVHGSNDDLEIDF